MKNRQKKIDEVLKSDPFYTPDTNLDLSGFPHLQESASDELPDARFAPLDTRGFGGMKDHALKKFLQNPDSEAITEAAERSGHPELARYLSEEKELAEAEHFMAAHPDYYRTDDNYEVIRAYLDEHRLEFNRDTLAQAFRALTTAGGLEFQPCKVRPLTQRELLEVSNVAQMGSNDATTEALARYTMYASNGRQLSSPFELIDDPESRKMCDEAVWFVWENRTVDYSPTPERRQFIANYLAERHATIALLDAAWLACQQAEKDASRSGLFRQISRQDSEPSAEEVRAQLEEMSDAEIENTMKRALRVHAEKSRSR